MPVIKITVPGSKSIANRALVLNFLNPKKAKLKNIPECDDCSYMLAALDKLKQSSKGKKIDIYAGNAGTTTRFLTALCTIMDKEIKIYGDQRMSERPIEELVKALNNLGAKIICPSGCPPLHIFPQKIQGGTITLPGNISSQYISALLMICPFAEKKTIISIEQELYSKPYVALTLKILKEFGIKIKNNNFTQFVIPAHQKVKRPNTFTIESDASSASYIGAYAALHPRKEILLCNIHKSSSQGDIKFLHYLKKIGCTITDKSTGTKIKGISKLTSLGLIDMNQTPDLVMTFAVLALFTSGPTKISNIANLRIKETDRIKALENELKKLGAQVKAGKDYLEIYELSASQIENLSSKKHPKIKIATYNDHRIAMAFAIIQDLFPCLKIQNQNCVSKSYTTFWQDLKRLQAV